MNDIVDIYGFVKNNLESLMHWFNQIPMTFFKSTIDFSLGSFFGTAFGVYIVFYALWKRWE